MKTFISFSFFVSLSVLTFANDPVLIKGNVSEWMYNAPLKDAHVYITESLGTVTDGNGQFILSVPEAYKNSELNISYIGYSPYKQKISEINSSLRVTLQPGAMLLAAEEIMVTPDPVDEFNEAVSFVLDSYEDTEQAMQVMYAELEKRDNTDSSFSILEGVMFTSFILIVLLTLFASRKLQRH